MDQQWQGRSSKVKLEDLSMTENEQKISSKAKAGAWLGGYGGTEHQAMSSGNLIGTFFFILLLDDATILQPNFKNS